jgi:hypothetical protein
MMVNVPYVVIVDVDVEDILQGLPYSIPVSVYVVFTTVAYDG